MSETEFTKLKNEILAEDIIRSKKLTAEYQPVTGFEAQGERVKIEIEDFIIPVQYVPKPMMNVQLVHDVVEAGSIDAFIEESELEITHEDVDLELVRLRRKHDFLFWAYDTIHIRSKIQEQGKVPFKLNYAQLHVLEACESMRLQGVPIDIIIVKARQWGGSTFCIFYQLWIALKWDEYHSFAIAAQVNSASETVLQMLILAIEDYPAWDLGLPYEESLHLGRLGTAGNAFVIKDSSDRRVLPAEIYIGSAQTPDSLRSKSIAGAHYSEVGVWQDTPGRRPEDLIADISGGIRKAHLSMQVFESSAKRSDDFFHEMYINAEKGQSSYTPIFIPWFMIPFDSLKIAEGKEAFVEWLVKHKDNNAPNGKWKDSGKHYWWLWTLGATLEGINWYRYKRLDYTTYSQMANEAPSTSIEAFQASGNHVFDPYDVDRLSRGCKPPFYEGELISDAREGSDVLKGIRFLERSGGDLRIWEMPDLTPVSNRYLVVVDVGGPNPTSDYSSVRVLDRLMLMPCYDGIVSVVAEMHYHTDHDLLAYDAMRLAKWYNDALLVIESNTLETRDKERDTGGYGSDYILDIVSQIYGNLYMRESDADNIKPGSPAKWGFHTNTKTKPTIIDNMKKCLRDELWYEPSITCCEEMSMYIDENGKMTAPAGKHDDVLMSTAIGLWIAYRKMELPRMIEKRAAKRISISGNNSVSI